MASAARFGLDLASATRAWPKYSDARAGASGGIEVDYASSTSANAEFALHIFVGGVHQIQRRLNRLFTGKRIRRL